MKKPKQKFKKPPRLPFTPLLMKERDHLITMLNDPVFQKALSNVQAMKPAVETRGTGSNAEAAGSVEMALHLANNRIHTLLGWQLFEAALALQTQEPAPKRTPVNDDFPDAGRIAHE